MAGQNPAGGSGSSPARHGVPQPLGLPSLPQVPGRFQSPKAAADDVVRAGFGAVRFGQTDDLLPSMKVEGSLEDRFPEGVVKTALCLTSLLLLATGYQALDVQQLKMGLSPTTVKALLCSAGIEGGSWQERSLLVVMAEFVRVLENLEGIAEANPGGPAASCLKFLAFAVIRKLFILWKASLPHANPAKCGRGVSPTCCLLGPPGILDYALEAYANLDARGLMQPARIDTNALYVVEVKAETLLAKIEEYESTGNPAVMRIIRHSTPLIGQDHLRPLKNRAKAKGAWTGALDTKGNAIWKRHIERRWEDQDQDVLHHAKDLISFLMHMTTL